MNKRALTAAVLLVGAMYSQTPPRSGRAIDTPVTALRSPEGNADRTVTLRFRAPEAIAIRLDYGRFSTSQPV